MRFGSTLVIAGVTMLATCSEQPPSAPNDQAPAPLYAAGGPVEGRYIVVFKDAVADDLPDQLVRAYGGRVTHHYRHALQGFSAELPPQALEAIRRNPNVDYVEVDGVASISESPQTLPGTNQQWGLDRVDQRDLPLDFAYNYENQGEGVEAFILDTGIRYTHEQFGGRALSGPDFVSGDDFSEDCHGHGTHVAGTVGGNTTGIAKHVTLYGVRVLGCNGSGSYSGIIAALDWITARKQANPGTGMVGNMSLSGGASSSVNQAVNNSVAAGVVWSVAAGNDNGDACGRSPASADDALTVGATTSSDARASFSNFGICLDLFAPGSSIYSSTFDGDNTYGSWAGTSMAAPHVAGVAALYLASNPTATGYQVNDVITAQATPAHVTNPGTGSPNLLLYSLVAGAAVPPPPPPPPPPPSSTTVVRVTALTGSGALQGKKNWRATITATVLTDEGVAVSGATVSGAFSTGATVSCVTASNGVCSIVSGTLRNSTVSTQFTVGNVTGSGQQWDAVNSVMTVVVVRP